MPDHDYRRSLSYGRAYGLKGGSYAEQRREVRPPHDDYATRDNKHLKKFLEIFERRGVGSAFKDKMDATAA